MTKAEAKEYLDNYRKMYADLAPERFLDALDIMLNEPSLPSNLDEAAEEIASDIAPTHPDIGWNECFEKIKEGIKAGAEWMAGQGVTCEGVIFGDKYFRHKNVEMHLSDEQYDKVGDFGDKVIVQIRKAK